MSIEITAKNFASRKPGKCHNARTDGTTYWLHGHVIAQYIEPKVVRTSWCGWRTVTTQNHINKVLRALGVHVTLPRKGSDEVQDWQLGANQP